MVWRASWCPWPRAENQASALEPRPLASGQRRGRHTSEAKKAARDAVRDAKLQMLHDGLADGVCALGRLGAATRCAGDGHAAARASAALLVTPWRISAITTCARRRGRKP
jgi:hypothetical protein